MGTLTLADFRADTLEGLLDRTDVSDGSLDRWINFAYLHVANPRTVKHRALAVSEDEPLVVDTDTYDLSTAIVRFWAIRHVRYPAGFKRLEPTSIEELDDLLKPTGAPSRYAMDGNILTLDTLPGSSDVGETDDVLRIRYWQRPTPLVIDGGAGLPTTTVIDDLWDPVIIEGSIFYAWLGMGQIARADAAREGFAVLINEVRELQDVDAEAEGHRIRPIIQDYQRP